MGGRGEVYGVDEQLKPKTWNFEENYIGHLNAYGLRGLS
jgi:hypothetical protein